MKSFLAPRFALASAAAALIATAATADNLDRSIYIVNDGATAIYSVHIANIDDGVWHDDLLGGYMLPAGYNQLFEPDYIRGYCRFDIRIEYLHEEVIQLNDVNLCEADAVITSEAGGYVEYMDGGTSRFISASY